MVLTKGDLGGNRRGRGSRALRGWNLQARPER